MWRNLLKYFAVTASIILTTGSLLVLGFWFRAFSPELYTTSLDESGIYRQTSIVIQDYAVYSLSTFGQEELAKVFGIKINNVELESMKTPSYPSGHSAQGFLIGNFLSNKHKEKDFKKIGEEISESRNMAKAHYKSDSDMGKKLGQSMFNYLNKEYGKS